MVLQVGRVLKGLVAHLAGERPLPSVNTLVPPQVAQLSEGLAALLTLEGLFTGVDAHVASQSLRASEDFVTDLAGHLLFGLAVYALVLLEVKHVHERLAAQGAEVLAFAHMVAHVPLQHGQVDEALAALGAVVGPLHCVVALVHPQLEGRGEGLLTVRARVMVLGGVAGLVNLQIGGLGETLSTNSALVRLLTCVYQVMFHHVSALPEGLVAHLALERAHVGVDLLVDYQEAAGTERLAANGALEWFLTCVCALMVVQLTLVRKVFTTLGTRERLALLPILGGFLGFTWCPFARCGVFAQNSLVLVST